jgi:hypothetical protein
MRNSFVRWLLLFMLGIATFALGLLRTKYVLNFIHTSLPFLLPRNTAEQVDYPLTFTALLHSLAQDPRWLSAFFYMIYPAIGTSVAVYLLFHKKQYLQLTLLFYSTGLLLLLLMVLYSISFHEYDNGYALAQYIKKIYQEPYASLLLLGSFYWDTKKRVESEE